MLIQQYRTIQSLSTRRDIHGHPAQAALVAAFEVVGFSGRDAVSFAQIFVGHGIFRASCSVVANIWIAIDYTLDINFMQQKVKLI